MPGTGPSPGCAVPLRSAPVAGPDEGLVDPPDAVDGLGGVSRHMGHRVDAAQAECHPEVHKGLGALEGLPIHRQQSL